MQYETVTHYRSSIYLNSISGNEELPIKSIHHTEGSSATLGGYVYRGNDLPQLYGRYVYADFLKYVLSCKFKIINDTRKVETYI